MTDSAGKAIAPKFEAFSPWHPEFGDMAVYGLIILILIMGLLVLTRWLGARKATEIEAFFPYI